eukprot:3827221-Pyramimonas_sp.AAC.1
MGSILVSGHRPRRHQEHPHLEAMVRGVHAAVFAPTRTSSKSPPIARPRPDHEHRQYSKGIMRHTVGDLKEAKKGSSRLLHHAHRTGGRSANAGIEALCPQLLQDRALAFEDEHPEYYDDSDSGTLTVGQSLPVATHHSRRQPD